MSYVDSLPHFGKRVAAAFLALFVFIVAIISLFRGAVALSIILHIVGIALIVYIAYESAPPR